MFMPLARLVQYPSAQFAAEEWGEDGVEQPRTKWNRDRSMERD